MSHKHQSEKSFSQRSRHPSEKGRTYQLEVLQKKKDAVANQIHQQISVINDLMEYEDVNTAEDISQQVQTLFEQFESHHDKYQALLVDPTEIENAKKIAQQLRHDVISQKDRYECWMWKGNKKPPSIKSSKSSGGSSKASSSKSKLVELMKLEQARLAELKVEQNYLQQKKQRDLQLLNLQDENERLKIQFEIDKSLVKMQVFKEESLDGESKEIDLLLQSLPKHESLTRDYVNNFKVEPVKDALFDKVCESHDSEVLTILKQSKAPTVDLDVFTGNPVDFPYFITTFSQAVECNIPDERGRLSRMIKYTQGEAKDLVKSCVYLPESICYKRAKELLQERYGSPYKIAAEYRKQLQAWLRLKANDTSSFTKFQTFLIKFQSAMSCVGRSASCSPELIQVLQSKLPTYLQDKWNRAAFRIRSESKGTEEANLDYFIKFLTTETNIISDPLYSREAINEISKAHTADGKSGRIRSLATGTGENCCICCQQSSCKDLESCCKFLKMELQDRRKFVFQKRLCFCCFQPTSSTHRANTCERKRVCRECKGKHPTSLHGLPSKDKTNPSTTKERVASVSIKGLATSTKEVISMCVVPVTVQHRSNPHQRVKTFALLDNGSQATFIHQNLINQLEIEGSKTSLQIQTISGEVTEHCISITGLQVSSDHLSLPVTIIDLPKTYSRPFLPVDVNEVPTAERLVKWNYLSSIFKFMPDASGISEVGLLIGGNCPKALEPLQTIHSEQGGPYAYRSRLGWCVAGPMCIDQPIKISSSCNRISVQKVDGNESIANHYFSVKEHVKDLSIKELFLASYSVDFHESTNCVPVSIEDKRFLHKMNENARQINGHYVLPLPLRDPEKIVPNNRHQVVQRANWLKQRLIKHPKILADYQAFMTNIIQKGYAKVASDAPTINKTWYIPHHGIYNPRKPDKIRVVFDCSMKYKDYCINHEVLQGPDLTNQLIGVLLRFREEPVAVMGDIEAMYYQVKIPPEDYDYLRFVWWPDGDLSQSLVDYQMCVHLFGGTSSPSCANFALRKSADDYKHMYGDEAAETLYRNFYVDDMLKSFADANSAIRTIPNVIDMCKAGGFRLTKFYSNNRSVLQTIPDEEKSKSLRNLDLSSTQLPSERALGMHWCAESDVFSFKVMLEEKPETRRGILSSISSIYDPLGLVSPFLLEGKKLLQSICSEKCSWDMELSSHQKAAWQKWKSQLPTIQQLRFDRCFKPTDVTSIKSTSLHHFSDAACDGYGQASYIRYVSTDGRVHCMLVMAKSRVAPIKRPTIPRLELTAAVLSVKVSISLKKELDVHIDEEFFWTDSQVVLSYISNESKRFHIFVANRVQFIHDNCSTHQWRYVPSNENPADDASRGLNSSTSSKIERWIHGPAFLHRPRCNWSSQPSSLSLNQGDKEIRKVKSNVIIKCSNESIITQLEQRTSNWLRMKRIIATVLMWRSKEKKILVEDLKKAQSAIIRLVQKRAFADEVKTLSSTANRSLQIKGEVKKRSQLAGLSPFVDNEGILRVGGRIQESEASFNIKHPIILPRRCETTNSIINFLHQSLHHAGRNATLNHLRVNGYWVINGNSLVRFILSKCVICRSLRGTTEVQQMANLPKDRLQEAPPFTHIGLDMFGPFVIKERRSELKRYSIIFTCLSSRAVHFESVSSMDTDSFILCLRRFIGRRGCIRSIRCDNGTNFVGARNELKRALEEMDVDKVTNFLLNEGADFITWKHNPPYSSNFGGAWERLIRSARTILDGLMKSHGHYLNDESFRTLLVEVEAIINSRPLTVDTVSDPHSPLPLAPTNLLTMKSKVILPPPGIFQREDLYCRRRWRRIQHLSDEFWSRWRKEYLQQLQTRVMWRNKKRNMKVGDVILVKDDNVVRNEWKMGVVEKVFASNDGMIRTVLIRRGDASYERPVNKLVLLVENTQFPDEEPNKD